MHYTTNGTVATDRTVLALRYAKGTPKLQAVTANALNFNFLIPANTDNYEVKSTFTTKKDVDLVGFMPSSYPLLMQS